MPTSEIVTILITRDRDSEDGLEILTYTEAEAQPDEAMPLRLPEGRVTAGEHPTEAALRIAAVTTGYDVYFTFRKLATATDGDATRYVYQTSPEVDLPATFTCIDPVTKHTRHFAWLDEAEAPRLPSPVRAALARLAGA